MLGNDVQLLPVSNIGVAKPYAVKLGLTKDGMPCHQQKTLKPGTKVIATTTQCKTPAKARVTNVLDENDPRLLSFVAQCNGVSVECLVDSDATHSFVKHDVVVKTGCTTAAAPVLSVMLANEKTVISDSLAHLDLMAVGAGTEYSMPGVPCHVLP